MRSSRRSRGPAAGVVVVVLVVLLLLIGRALTHGSGSSGTSSGTPGAAAPASSASRSSTGGAGGPDCPLGGLPAQAQATVQEVYAGGPFPYRQDGVVFDNRERRLPQEPHGYYHEYTVPTPGSADRGARRVIAGGGTRTAPEVFYYTANHYASFCLVSSLD